MSTTLSAGTATSGAALSSDTSGVLQLQSGSTPTTAVTIDTSQNVGIGVTPSAWNSGLGFPALQLKTGGAFWSTTTNGTVFSQNEYYGSGGATYLTTAPASYYQQYNGTHIWNVAASGTAGTSVSYGSAAMTLDNSGNLLVGTTSVTSAPTQGVINYVAASSAVFIGHASGVGTGSTFATFSYNGSNIGSITQSGTTAVLYNVTSDQRLKENIVDAPDASADIDAIKIRSFDFISDKSPVKYGFIAQELVTVAPDAVHQPSNPEEMMGVDYSKLVPMMLKEIQSLRARLKAANIA